MQEPQYRSANRRVRPFAQSAGVKARGCSRRLQRALTDLGADLSYAQVMDKVVEHYGIVIAESTIRRTTLQHAQKIHQRSLGLPQGLPNKVPPAQVFVAEMDGTMVPTVQSDANQRDRRKGKSVQWQEAKVSLAHVQGSKELVYAATLTGDVTQQANNCARAPDGPDSAKVTGYTAWETVPPGLPTR